MRFFTLLRSATVLLSASFGLAQAQNASFPALTFIGSLSVNATPAQEFPVYGGTRITNSYIAGYAADASGKTIATLVPGEGGEAALDLATAHATFQFLRENNTFAFVTLQSVLNSTQFYVNFQTSSVQYGYLNKLFILAQGSKPVPGTLHFDLFSPGAVLPRV